MTPPRSKPDDPFDDDGWGPPSGEGESNEAPEAQVDTTKTDFLKPEHVRKDSGTVELIGWGHATIHSAIVLNVTLNGKPYRVGLKEFDKSYVALRKRFGADKTQWHGTIRYKVMPWKGNPRSYIAYRP